MSKCLIINEIKGHYGFKTDAEFARFLEISPQVLANWYRRNTFNYEIVYRKYLDISADWLLTGEGKMLKSENKNENDAMHLHIIESIALLSELSRKQQEEIDRFTLLLSNLSNE